MKYLWIFIGCVALSLPVSAEQRPRNIAEFFGGEDAVSLVKTADSVDVIPLYPRASKDDSKKTVYVEGKAIKMPEGDLESVKSILFNELAFEWNARSSCIPSFDLRLKIISKGRALQFDFCFICRAVDVSNASGYTEGEMMNGTAMILLGDILEKYAKFRRPRPAK